MDDMRDTASPFASGLAHPMVWLGVIVGTLVSLYLIESVWWLSIPLVVSVVICHVSRPFLLWFRRRGLSPLQALYGYLVVVLAAMMLVIVLLLPWLSAQFIALRDDVPEFWDRIEGLLLRWVEELETKFPGIDGEQAAATLREKLDGVESVLLTDWLPGIAVHVVSWIPSLLLIPYLTFFILKDGARLKQLILRGVPNAYFEKVLILFYNMDGQMKKFFRGLMAMTFLDTVTLAAGLYCIGRPYGVFDPAESLFLGLLSAVLAWIPYLGTALACLIMVMVCLTEAPGEWSLVALAVGLFLVVRTLDDFVYTPMTVGRSLKSHPLLTVMIVFAAGYFAGVLGLLLAMPVLGIWMAFGDTFGQAWFDERLRARYLQSRRAKKIRAQEGLGV
ncbi:MAG: AI-2E family transporter [Candidatus Methylacidiphilales bacterium]